MLALAKISPQLSEGSGTTPDLLAALLLRLRVLAASVVSEARPLTTDFASGRSGRGGNLPCDSSVAAPSEGPAVLLAADGSVALASFSEGKLLSGREVLLELLQL